MSGQFYADARLYDRLLSGGEEAVDFYRAEADRQGGRVLELGCGTGQKLIPIASPGHPDRGVVHVDVAESYDAAAQVTRGTWFFSTESGAEFAVAPLEIRSIFPQELPLLLELGGLRLVERFGDWSRAPFTADAALQLCICEVT